MDKFRRKLQVLQHKNQGTPLPPPKPEYKPQPPEQISISLCCTCKGRKEQLGHTIPHNLKIIGNDPQIEYIILDYDSPDDLKKFVEKYPKLRYFRVKNKPFFHHSEAKNIAHSKAENTIVINIDSETYFTEKFIKRIREEFTEDINTVVHCDHHGVIAMSRSNFKKLNGYDHKFIGWGMEDIDLVNRAKNYGLRHVKLKGKSYTSYHDHRDKERNKFTIIPKYLSYPANKELTRLNLENNITWVDNKPTYRNNKPLRFVVVVGLPRSGTSCVSGILEKLGVAFSPSMYGPKKRNEKGFYECVVLAVICHKCVTQPGLEYRIDYEHRTKKLAELYKYYRFGINNDQLIGMKHPLMCMMIPEVEEIFKEVIWINVIRPIEKVKESATKVGWWDGKNATHAMLDKMEIERNIQMRRRDHLDVYYERLFTNPVSEIGSIASYIGTKVNQGAIDFVDVNLRHF